MRRALQVKPGVVRIRGTPLQAEHHQSPPPTRSPVGILVCGMICLFPALFVASGFYAHIFNDRHFWDSSEFLKMVLFSFPVYGSLVGGPIAVITAAGVLRSGPSLKWLRIALAGAAISFGWSLLPILVRVVDPGVQLTALLTGGASLYVLASTGRQAFRRHDRKVA